MFSNTSGLRRKPAAIDLRSRMPGRTLLAALLLAAAATTGSASGIDQPPAPVSIEMPAGDTLSLVAASAQVAPAAGRPTTSLPVSNCNNDGPGSLRSVIEAAGDGDTVDLTGLNCVIELATQLSIQQDNLTIQGHPVHAGGSPVSILDAQNNGRVIFHLGNGILQIKDLWLRKGSVEAFVSIFDWGAPRGGCIRSSGSVLLENSLVSECSVSDPSPQPSFSSLGGAIYAEFSVGTIRTVLRDNQATSSEETAGGGAIWANSLLVLTDSTLEDNLASSGTGWATGGGGAAGEQLLVSGSIVRGNRAQTVSGTASGGGLNLRGFNFSSSSSQSVISHSQFLDNRIEVQSPMAGSGGGLFIGNASMPTVLIGDSVFRGNHAPWSAGGLMVLPPLVMARTTVAENSAARNGGISTSGATSIMASTIANNEALQSAGAALGTQLTPSDPTVIQIVHSTISGNSSSHPTGGAGLRLAHDTQIWNSTITGNTETGLTPLGAGIALHADVQVELRSSIVAGNYFLHSELPAIATSDIGSISSSQGTVLGMDNLLGKLQNVSTGVSDSFLEIEDPGLKPLANNGGPTWTHLPKADSPAIDAGADNWYTEDQRGTSYSRLIGLRADIGAVELDEDRIFRHDFDHGAVAL